MKDSHSTRGNCKSPLSESFRLTASRVARDKPWSTLCKKSHGIPSSPRAAAVAKFRLLTGHDCLCAHLFRFNLVTSPICVLCDTGQDMTAAHLDECSALNDLNCIVKSLQVNVSQLAFIFTRQSSCEKNFSHKYREHIWGFLTTLASPRPKNFCRYLLTLAIDNTKSQRAHLVDEYSSADQVNRCSIFGRKFDKAFMGQGL
ncbi:uncharacterized protein TNCV_3203341 [Trichonephila clavipes]|nr:uncharacterized protein TNCV_3203341 [Trichonephila clavipes]